MTGHEVLIGAAAAVVYAGWAYAHPFRKCWACKGTGQNSGSTKHRWGKCWRCKGRREIQTLGSRMLHRLVRAVREQSWKGK